MIQLRVTSESQAVLVRNTDATHVSFIGLTRVRQLVTFCNNEPCRVCTRDLPVFHQVQKFALALQRAAYTYISDYSYVHVYVFHVVFPSGLLNIITSGR